MLKPAPEVNYLLKLSSIRLTFVFRQVHLQIKLFLCRKLLFCSQLFVLRGEIASRNISKCSSKTREQNLSMILKALCSTRSYTWLLLRFMQNQELYPLLAKLGGDLNVQIKGTANYVFLFSKFNITKTGICRNVKFD